MSIAAMSKVSLCGPAAEKSAALAALQELGCVHILPLAASPRAEGVDRPGEAHQIRAALAYLERSPHLRRPLSADSDFDIHAVARRVLDNQARQRSLRDRREFLRSRLANLWSWGDFTLPPLAALEGHRLWFYEVPHRRRRALSRVSLPWVEVARSPSTHFVVVVSPDEPPEDAMPVHRTRTGPHSLNTVSRMLEDTEVELEDLELERIALTRYVRLIRKDLARADDAAALSRAVAEARETDGLFAVEGWAPDDRLERIEGFAEARGLALLVAPPAPDETPPTRLDNRMPAAAGEPLAHFYQVPSPRDWDPSALLVVSFALFFAMIVSDAGYAALVLLASVALWPRLGRDATGRRLRVLMLTLGGAALAYGVAAGSYFGLPPLANSLPAALVVVDPRDPNTMMTLSIAIGVVHVVLGSAAVAWRRWPQAPAFAAIGWMLVALGGFIAWRGHVADTIDIRSLGLSFAGTGLLAVVLFRGHETGARTPSFFKRAGAGLLGLTMVPKMLGDILSYLRLFALGLASASLAVTFNGLAADLAGGVGGIGLLAAILVAAIGHGLNFALALVGGVVHGLRLNFIEFYNWGLTEEGYLYRPLERKELQV